MTVLTRDRSAGLAIALATFLLDRGIKWWVAGPLDLQRIGAIKVLPFFDLRWVENLGVSLGMFTATSTEMRLGLIAATALIALGVLVWMLREKSFGDIVGLAFVLGGAMGNIFDRVSRGFVIDYADFHIGEWRPFLVFNLADAAITVGVLILLARSLLSRDKPAPPAETDPATETV